MLLVAAVAVVSVGRSGSAVEEVIPTACARPQVISDGTSLPAAWLKRHESRLELAKRGGAPVVFIGDTSTHLWEGSGKLIWEMYFADGTYRAVNLGFAGDRTENVLWRIDHGELDGFEARAIVLSVGCCNTLYGTSAQEPPVDTIYGISVIVSRILAKQPKARVILHPILPVGNDTLDPRRKRNDVINREIMKIADGRRVIWCDFTSQLTRSDGFLPVEISADRVNPTRWGYRLWANAILPLLDQIIAGREVVAGLYADSVASTLVSATGEKTTAPLAKIYFEGEDRHPDGYFPRMLQRRRQILTAPSRHIDLVFAGDSITHLWEGSANGKKVLEELRKTYSILDVGYGGECVEHLLWHLEHGELDGYSTSLVMLMIGTNNGIFEDKAAGVAAAVKTIRRKQPAARVLLLPIFPRGADAKDPQRKANEKANADIRKLADGKDVIWVDFSEKYLDKSGDTQWIMPDRLHPNEAGYRLWAEEVLPYFRKITGK